MAEDDGGLGIVTLIASAMSVVKIVQAIVSPVPGERTMVAIPSDMEIFVLIAAVGFAVFFGVCAFLYRYAEHNAKHDLKVKDNRVFAKGGLRFVGAEGLAIALTAVLSYYGAAVLPFKLGIADPALVDYILIAGVLALFGGIVLTVLFNEGVSGLGKFLKQKVDETVEATEEVTEAMQRALDEAKKLGLNKKQTKRFVEMKMADTEIVDEPAGPFDPPKEGEE